MSSVSVFPNTAENTENQSGCYIATIGLLCLVFGGSSQKRQLSELGKILIHFLDKN